MSGILAASLTVGLGISAVAATRTIEVEGRENHALRRNLCPKRYWPLMTELEDSL